MDRSAGAGHYDNSLAQGAPHFPRPARCLTEAQQRERLEPKCTPQHTPAARSAASCPLRFHPPVMDMKRQKACIAPRMSFGAPYSPSARTCR